MERPKFVPKSTLSVDRSPNLHHPWTRPTYDAKRHPDPIRRFSTMHWTDRPTDRRDRPTDRALESLMTIGRCATRATRSNNNTGFSLTWKAGKLGKIKEFRWWLLVSDMYRSSCVSVVYFSWKIENTHSMHAITIWWWKAVGVGGGEEPTKIT